MMTITPRITVSAVALGVVLAASGCGASSDQGDGSSPETLRIGVSTIPTTLDPAQEYSREGIGLMQLAAGTLTRVSVDGKNVEMELAESVTPGAERFVIELKPELKFSDNTPLTATDVVASFEHYLNDETSGYGYLWSSVDKVVAVDELTVEFDLNQPYPSLPYNLAWPAAAIIPSEAIEARGDKKLYEGDPLPTAGEFQVESLARDQVTLKANPNYSGEQPSVTTVEFSKISDPAARLAQIQGGQIDFADGITPRTAAQLTDPIEARTVTAATGAFFVGMNSRDGSVLSDVRIRKAIALAIDRDQINEVAYSGMNQPLGALFGTSSQYNEPFLPTEPDVSTAKELLVGTACANGCELRFLSVSDDDTYGDVAVVVQQNLAEVGIDVTIQKVEKSVSFDYAADGNYDLRVTALYDVADVPDSYLKFGLHSDFGALSTGYSNPEMNRLIEQVSTTTGPAQDLAVDQVNALSEEDVPLAPIADFIVVSGSRVSSDLFGVDASFFYHVG